MQIINIYWDKLNFDGKNISPLNGPTDYALYQIYGRHAAYGKDALLYIGQAFGQTFGQTFAQRLDKRWEFIESCADPHTLRIGRIVKSNIASETLDWNQKTRWDEMINSCEKLLIKTHAPAFNKTNNSGLCDINDPNKNIHIFNWGDFGDLLPEVSAYRYSYRYWNYETPLSADD